jgi:hypothetical protein
MNANTLVNRFEILIYSALISAMSGINHLRARILGSSTIQGQSYPHGETGDIHQIALPKSRSIALSWESFKAALLPLILWTVLGFAAGFLIGMLSPR